MRQDAWQFLVAVVLVGLGFGFALGWFWGLVAVGALLSLDYFAGHREVER